jgi:hypothetical protein
MKESHRATEKVEAFADDNNVMALMDNTSVLAIKEILTNFTALSGLRCNVDKSQILVAGTNQVPDYITESGFTVVTELKILGFNIMADFSDLKNNINSAIEKIRNQINFWNRYRLSLPGRICVAKTLLLSQLSFHASIIEILPDKIQEIERLINSYVLGSFRFDKNAVSCSAASGGLGLINVDNYIISLQSSWIKRAHAAPVDNWRNDIHEISGGMCYK